MRASHADRSPPAPPAVLQALVDPFARLGPGATAGLAVLAVALGLAASQLGVRFDGALDVHPVGGPVPLATALADQAAALLAPALVGWAALRGLGAPATFGRVAAVLGAARLPLVLVAPLTRVPLRGRPVAVMVVGSDVAPPALTPELLANVVAAMGAVTLFVWCVALAVSGLRAAGGVRGGRLAGAAAAALLGGELLAKLALAGLP